MSSTTNENPGCLSFFTNLFGRGKAAEPMTIEIVSAEPEVMPYRVRDDFLSPTEMSFYRVLQLAVGTHASIFAKVGLSDVFYVARPQENQSYRNRIAQKHVDFVMCDPQTLKPLFAVELDDTSHQRTDRQERDAFVDQVFQAANLPLVHMTAQREYRVHDLRTKIEAYLPAKVEAKPEVATATASQPQTPTAPSTSVQPISDRSTTPVSIAPVCPKCGIPMVVRTVAQGDHKGKQFYGCVNYPRCHEMKPLLPAKITT